MSTLNSQSITQLFYNFYCVEVKDYLGKFVVPDWSLFTDPYDSAIQSFESLIQIDYGTAKEWICDIARSFGIDGSRLHPQFTMTLLLRELKDAAIRDCA